MFLPPSCALNAFKRKQLHKYALAGSGRREQVWVMCGVTPSCHCAVSSLKYHEGTLYNTIQGCAQDLIIYLNSYEPTQQTIHAIMVMQQPDTQDPSNYQGEEMEKK